MVHEMNFDPYFGSCIMFHILISVIFLSFSFSYKPKKGKKMLYAKTLINHLNIFIRSKNVTIPSENLRPIFACICNTLQIQSTSTILNTIYLELSVCTTFALTTVLSIQYISQTFAAHFVTI